MNNPHTPYFPIIYVRGYAMTQGEQDETTADPFCGFNLGSTVFRAVTAKDKPARKFVFESPVVRLMSDHKYLDVYEHGLDIMDPDWDGTIPSRSIVIYRYYEQASALLGTGKTPGIDVFAKGLNDLILRVRDLVCGHKYKDANEQEIDPQPAVTPETFRCYLIAHSMGGLVCRAFLQNPAFGSDEARRAVDKVFTYATPHNGIETAGINVPKWLTIADINNFNRDYMAEYLGLDQLAIYQSSKRADWLPEAAFPIERFFCMVGTNRADYEVAAGMSRTFAGHGSDGLVKVENASVWGINASGQKQTPCATAYAFRSHSGYFGIVNSEEAYQNLTRFLFGDLRVDIWIDIDAVRLPADIEGKAVDALYQFELLASPRGKRWYLTRRMAEEDSVACRTHRQLMNPGDSTARNIYLSTLFLAKSARVDPNRRSLAYGMTLGVRVPDYEVDKRFRPDRHYEGGYLFRDELVVEITEPQSEKERWKLGYDWQSRNPGGASRKLDHEKLPDGSLRMTVDFDSGTAPGIAGKLRFMVRTWND